MHPITLVVAIVAAVLFGLEGSRTKSLIAWGLCALAVAVIFAFTLVGEDLIYFIE